MDFEIAAVVPSLDFVSWNHVPYVIMRFYDYLARIINVEVQELPFGITRFDSGRGVDAGGHYLVDPADGLW